MRDKESLTELMNALSLQYTPEEPERKLGIGHDIEHVKGAVLRAGKIVDEMEKDPVMYAVRIDRDIVTAASALHDIGNTINRKDHATIGAGIVEGSLNVDRVLCVPIQSENDGLFLTDGQKEQVRNVLNGEMPDDRMPDRLSDVVASCLAVIMKFDLGYYGAGGEDPNRMERGELWRYLEDRYAGIDQETVTSAIDTLYKDDRLNDISYNPALKDITEQLREVFTPEELGTIADAVQDHNIDYEGIGQRYAARNIYGSIIFDADKDDVIGTSVIRTMAFSVNKCACTNTWFILPDGTPDMERCGWNVMEQMWERFRMPLDPRSPEARMQVIPPSILEHKALSDIKGVVSGTGAVEKFIRENPEYADNVHEHGGTPYVIMQTYGDDVFSQVDYRFSPETREDPLNGKILSLRMDCIMASADMACAAENPTLEKELPPGLRTEGIISAFTEAGTIEGAVDEAELAYHGGGDNSWGHVIAVSLGGEDRRVSGFAYPDGVFFRVDGDEADIDVPDRPGMAAAGMPEGAEAAAAAADIAPDGRNGRTDTDSRPTGDMTATRDMDAAEETDVGTEDTESRDRRDGIDADDGAVDAE